MGMPAIEHDRSLINWVQSSILQREQTRGCCVSRVPRDVQWFQKGVSRKVPTNQNCLEERDASPQSSHLQNVHSWKISEVILSGLLNKLPYEQEFENPVNISPPKCALTSFTPVSAFCCFSFSICCIILKKKNKSRYMRVEESCLFCKRLGKVTSVDSHLHILFKQLPHFIFITSCVHCLNLCRCTTLPHLFPQLSRELL